MNSHHWKYILMGETDNKKYKLVKYKILEIDKDKKENRKDGWEICELIMFKDSLHFSVAMCLINR